jgi:hypothetical protein
MPTSVYFNNYNSTAEQRVIEDLIVESMQIMGFDAFYLPIENPEDRDILYGEDPVKKFKSAFPLEMYLSGDVMDYQGQQEFFSKFGLEIKDKVNLVFARKRFKQEVTNNKSSITRPREGDLIYFPPSKSLFEINFVEHENPFYPLGRLYSYFITAELFTYSYEKIDTNVKEIDDVYTETKLENQYIVSEGSGQFRVGDTATLYRILPTSPNIIE